METKNYRIKAKKIDRDQRTFSGYAAVFGNVDSYNDIIERGAFKKTIQERGDRIKVMYNHMWMIGRVQAIEETAKGLYVECYISDTMRGNEVLTLIHDGAVDEMSIGYEPINSQYEDVKGEKVRIIREIKLYEVSPVDFAANDQAIITEIKSLAMLRGYDVTDDDIERLMQSITAMKTGRKAPEEVPDEIADNIFAKLNQIKEILHGNQGAL